MNTLAITYHFEFEYSLLFAIYTYIPQNLKYINKVKLNNCPILENFIHVRV